MSKYFGLKAKVQVLMLKDVQQRGRCFARQCQGFPGFRVQLPAKHPEGSDGSCVRFDNKLSRLCTLVDLQDV